MSTDREKRAGANTAGQSALIEPLEAGQLLRLSAKSGHTLIFNMGIFTKDQAVESFIDATGEVPETEHLYTFDVVHPHELATWARYGH